MDDRRTEPADSDRLRHAEAALRRLGFARVPPATDTRAGAQFWVQESGVPRRRFPVFVGAAPHPRTLEASRADVTPHRGIVVVNSDQAADEAWRSTHRAPAGGLDAEFAILVVPSRGTGESASAHWHAGTLDRLELLRLATGVVVGLFRRAERTDAGPVDFGELLVLLRRRFGVDVHRSLGVEDDEDALFMLYQLAQRYSWVPGEGGSNVHSIVLKPTGPAARLPWFAA